METQLNKDFKEFLGLLEKHNVRYLVIGGWAVAFHGYPRYTGDIDIWVKGDDDTASKLLEVLREFGFSSLGLTEADFLKDKAVIQLGQEPVRIDIIVENYLFDRAFRTRKKFKVNGFFIKMVSLPMLILLKKNAGRKIDEADVERLERVKKSKKRKR